MDLPFFPLAGCEPPGALVLVGGRFFATGGAEALRGLLESRGVNQVFALREDFSALQMDLAWADFQYDGLECFYGDESRGWLVYASHEDSLTILGSELTAPLRARRFESNRGGR